MNFGDMISKFLAVFPIVPSIIVMPVVIIFLTGLLVFMAVFFRKEFARNQGKLPKIVKKIREVKKVLPWKFEFMTPGNNLLK